ncbi:MAG TPA: HugZ family protein [Leucothrix mucor]|nr:HugZ family protein [Leucothrix mucor]
MKRSPDDALAELQKTTQSLFLSTLTVDGKPNGSYAPYILDDKGSFYIFVSRLASHTNDLLNNPQVSILIAEDEQDARQLFARQRVSYYCHCSVIEKEVDAYDALINSFETRFGNIIGLLRTLPDFILFKLDVQSGTFVQGFAQAYEISANGLIHKDPSQN